VVRVDCEEDEGVVRVMFSIMFSIVRRDEGRREGGRRKLTDLRVIVTSIKQEKEKKRASGVNSHK
jgi:hypothetical protein